MGSYKYFIKNKIPGLSYAFTADGIELPVLDITHPDFVSWTNDGLLEKLLPYVEKNAEENAAKFKKIPAFIKRFFAKRSFVMAELLQSGGESTFASGITTLMMKLGPELIGKGKKRFWDRQVTKGFGALVIRMRVRDISKIQAESLIPLLEKNPGRNLCFVNIAGGSAADSINTLFLTGKENRELLRNRKIEINVLDTDSFGPAFAEKSIEALKQPGGKFAGLDVSFRHIHYDWNDPEKLSGILPLRKDWIQVISSEGGLFEYCSDEIIKRNLSVLSALSAGDAFIAGSLLHDITEVDAGIVAALKISTNIVPRFLGINGLKGIVERDKWQIERIIEGNPRYQVFTLAKSK